MFATPKWFVFVIYAPAVFRGLSTMTHFFTRERADKTQKLWQEHHKMTRALTRAQHTAAALKHQEEEMKDMFPASWKCNDCDHENRCLRSTRHQISTCSPPECANCHNDYIFAIVSAPRKLAHRRLLEERPVQVRLHRDTSV